MLKSNLSLVPDNEYKIGDIVIYFTKGNEPENIGMPFCEECPIVKINGDMITIKTRDNGRVNVHRGNTEISADWIILKDKIA